MSKFLLFVEFSLGLVTSVINLLHYPKHYQTIYLIETLVIRVVRKKLGEKKITMCKYFPPNIKLAISNVLATKAA
jgi:hypothetical protein